MEEEQLMEVHSPRNGWPIRTLYTFLSIDEGGEGICSTQIGDTHFPLVASNPKSLEIMKLHAQKMSELTGKKIVLVEFKRNGKELWSSTMPGERGATPGSSPRG
jgi:hypothetical protein